MTRTAKFFLVLIFVLGFVLRFGGLDHDLHEGQIYHPDTPKQIRAAERFLDGHYYVHYGDLDYDIYPYFNSHLIEYLCRAGDLAHGGMQALMGLPVTSGLPDYYELFWITRMWNALLATLLILIVFQLARENWDLRAAFAAALFMAVSPADVTSAHFAGADTTAGFFATVTVFFAFRIYRLGRTRDYALAALFAACGFSTKYHAGITLLPILLAHGLRMGSWRALAGRASLGRVALLALVGLPATLLTTPILLTHFQETVQNILRFFFQISSYRGVDESIRHGAWSTKFIFAMHRNLPILVRIIGPLLCFGAVWGLKDVFRRRPDPRAVILYALPLVYFLVGVSLRPLAHPIYHTLMTPLVFVAAAVVFTRPFTRLENKHGWFARLRLAVIAISAVLLLNTAAKEVFFFWHQDVSRLAKAWAEENVPPQFAVRLENYSFTSDRFANSTNAVGTAWAATAPEKPPAAFRLVKNFSLEQESMAVFRNIPIRFYVNTSPWLRPDFQMPVFQRAPSRDGNQIICDNGPKFLCSEKLLVVEPVAEPTVRWLVRPTPPGEVWLCMQNGSTPNFSDICFGGSRRRSSLNAGEVAWWPVPAPRASWPHEPGLRWYRWSAQTFYGQAHVLLATQPGEIGAFLFNAGNYRDAFAFLQTAAVRSHNPVLAAMAQLCAQHEKLPLTPAVQADLARLARPLQAIHDAAGCRNLFGIAPAYLEALDFISLPARDCRCMGCRTTDDPEIGGQRVVEKIAVTSAAAATNPPPCLATPALFLSPGAYVMTLQVRGTAATPQPIRWRLTAREASDAICAETEFDLPPLDARRYTNVVVPFKIPSPAADVRIILMPQNPAGVLLNQIEIKPDTLATLQWLKQELQHPSVSRATAPTTAGFQQTVDTVFQGGLRLVSLQTSRSTLAGGQSLGMNFQFRLEQPDLNVVNLAVFVHFVDGSGRLVFQGDYGVADVMNYYVSRYAQARPFQKTIQIPAATPPGNYQIQVGICRLDDNQRLGIVSSLLPQKTKAVLLRDPIRVTP